MKGGNMENKKAEAIEIDQDTLNNGKKSTKQHHQVFKTTKNSKF